MERVNELRLCHAQGNADRHEQHLSDRRMHSRVHHIHRSYIHAAVRRPQPCRDPGHNRCDHRHAGRRTDQNRSVHGTTLSENEPPDRHDRLRIDLSTRRSSNSFLPDLLCLGLFVGLYSVRDSLFFPTQQDALTTVASEGHRAGLASNASFLRKVGTTASSVILGLLLAAGGYVPVCVTAAALSIGYAILITMYLSIDPGCRRADENTA